MSENAGTTERMTPWIKRYQSGDDAAWEEAIKHARGRLERIARKALHGSSVRRLEDTGDLVNEACLRLTQAFRSGPGGRPADVRGFFKLASKKIREALIDMYRRDQRYPGNADVPDVRDDASGPATRAAHEDAERRLHELVDKLPDDEREAWDLHYYQGLTHSDAAKFLTVSSKTVERRIISAKQKLHGWLVAEGLGPKA